ISNSWDQSHDALVNGALIRSQLQNSDLAIEDDEKVVYHDSTVPIVGYIAKSIALIENGQWDEGCRLFDLAFKHCDPNDVDYLLLLKAIVLFMAGKCNEAVSRVGDLIATVDSNATYYIVQVRA
ncbi:hypothetical protein EV363DRAFT_1171025, partial [Boletus edulis]